MDRSVLVVLQQTFHLISLHNINFRNFAMAANNILKQTETSTWKSKEYEKSIQTLNSLQSNAQTLAIPKTPQQLSGLIPKTIEYLERGGLSLAQLDSLNVIHVSGTKGKGTTCAFVESILRNCGLRTGFFSSPHLVAVRERIRINGKPLTEQKFSQYFFHVYDRMADKKVSENDMPPYFQFLTCMAYYVFFQEKVDVAIMEVGIGGRFDPTNIVRKPKVVGITSMGLDHQKVLGNSLQEITASKAGIMKTNVPSITTHNQPPEVIEWLRSHAKESNCPFYKAPPLEDYPEKILLGVDDGDVSRTNASLAIQLVNTFLSSSYPSRLLCQNSNGSSKFETGKVYPLQKWHLEGLESCTWNGRFEVIKVKDNLHYYLDGAHTEESLVAARNWFTKMTSSETNSFRVLVFYITGSRDAEKLLKSFTGQFDLTIFCPLVVCSNVNNAIADNWSSIASETENNCKVLANTWENLHLNGKPKVVIMDSVLETLQYLDNLTQDHKFYRNVNVLFTGSLLMVGNFLTVLKPESN